MFQRRINKCQPNHEAELMAHVFWYSPFPTHPSCHTRMYQVMQEVDMHEHQRAGIINLSWVKSICPLAPVFDETCKPNLISKCCLKQSAHITSIPIQATLSSAVSDGRMRCTC